MYLIFIRLYIIILLLYVNYRHSININIFVSLYSREQFFLSANELVDSLQRNDSKSYWSLIRKLIKGTSQNYSIRPCMIMIQMNWYMMTRLRQICWINKFVLFQLLMILIMFPHLIYACEVWDGCYERDIEKLEKLKGAKM